MNIRKNDNVMIITGRDKGKTGKVLSLDTATGRVIVQGLNMVKRHMKPTQSNPKGGIVQKEASVNISNVMYYDEKEAKPTRIGYKLAKDGKKVRFSKRSGALIDK